VERSTLDRARAGDERAFRELTEPYRLELQVHCYRMLGSLTDAEDMLQETLLAAWRGLGGFQERASVRSWLYRIATNRCLNMLRDAGRRVPTEPTPPFDPPSPTRRGEVTWLQPYPQALLAGLPDSAPGPEARYQTSEAVELAFIRALQRLPPRQAASLILRDVLGFTTDEVASLLNTTQTAIKGTLQRARSALENDLGTASGAASGDGRPARPGTEQERELSRRFAEAYTAGDVDGVVALLTDDAWLSMPPAPHEYQGIDAIAAFLRASFEQRGERPVYLVPVTANTQPAFGVYLGGQVRPVATATGLLVLTAAGGRIRALTRFHLDTLHPRFGLPEWVTEPAAPAGS